MNIEIKENQAALITTLEKDGESCNMRIVYDQKYNDLLPINIQMLFAIAELFQNDKEFMLTIEKTIREVFREPTTH